MFTGSYFLGAFWHIYINDIEEHTDDNFINVYELDQYTDS